MFLKQSLIVFFKNSLIEKDIEIDYRRDFRFCFLFFFFFFKQGCRLVSKGIGIVVDQPEQSYPRYHAHGREAMVNSPFVHIVYVYE